MNWRLTTRLAAISAAMIAPAFAGELNHYMPGIFGTRDFFVPPEPGLYYSQMDFSYLSDEFHDGNGNVLDELTIGRSLDVTRTVERSLSVALGKGRQSSFSFSYQGSTLDLGATLDASSGVNANLSVDAEATARLRANAIVRARLEDLDVRISGIAPTLVWASKEKILGARWGALISLPIVDISIDATVKGVAEFYARVNGQLTVRALGTLTAGSTVQGGLSASGPQGGTVQPTGSKSFTVSGSRQATVKKNFNANLKLKKEFQIDIHDARTDLGDLYVQPLWLTWSGDHYDFSLSDGFYAPTGYYEPGELDNTGMGYWSNQTQAAIAIYPWKSKGTAITAATTYEVHSNKEGADIRPGDTLTVNWGLSQYVPLNKEMTVLADIGVGGYDLWQVSDDKGSDVTYDSSVHDEVHAYGVQLGLAHVKWQATMTLRWMHEYSARDRFGGDMYVINFAKKF